MVLRGSLDGKNVQCNESSLSLRPKISFLIVLALIIFIVCIPLYITGVYLILSILWALIKELISGFNLSDFILSILVISGIGWIILGCGFSIRYVLNMLITEIYFSKSGLVVKQFFATKFSYGDLKAINKSYINFRFNGPIYTFVFNDGSKIYLSSRLYPNLCKMIVCAYKNVTNKKLKARLKEIFWCCISKRFLKANKD